MTDQTSIDALTALLGEFTRSGIATLHLRHGGFEILLSKDANISAQPLVAIAPAATAPIAAPTAPAATSPAPVATAAPIAPSALPADAVIITAPNLGTFYRAPKPGSAPYVEVGDQVLADDEICLIEVMKLFTAVKAGTTGRIHAVLAEDGAMVEAGQPLFALVTD